MKVCFSSVCTDDYYQFFIPLFVYTVKKAYPDAGVKIFIKGKLDDRVRNTLKLITYNGWEVKDRCFKSYPDKPYITNCLRFLIDENEYKGYVYVFIKDIDFLVFPHKVSHLRYFSKAMGKLPYFGVRGPYRYPRRYNINRIGWKGDFTRIAGGTFVLKNPEWFDKTRKLQKKYRKYLKRGISDGIDIHIPASYREYDEVMLYRIIKKSGLSVPTKKNKSANDRHVPLVFRDIHIGDFIKTHGKKKLAKKVSVENIKLFAKLEKDPVWIKIRKASAKRTMVKNALWHVKRYVEWRLHS